MDDPKGSDINVSASPASNEPTYTIDEVLIILQKVYPHLALQVILQELQMTCVSHAESNSGPQEGGQTETKPLTDNKVEERLLCLRKVSSVTTAQLAQILPRLKNSAKNLLFSPAITFDEKCLAMKRGPNLEGLQQKRTGDPFLDLPQNLFEFLPQSLVDFDKTIRIKATMHRILEKYVYNHWVQNNFDIPIKDTDPEELKVLKHLWNFDYQAALQLVNNSLAKQLKFLVPCLSAYASISSQCPTLKGLYAGRDCFKIKPTPEDQNKFKAMEYKLALSFRFLEEIRKSPQIEAILQYSIDFLICNKDDKDKEPNHLESLSTLPHIERLLYAKKFLQIKQFERQQRELCDWKNRQAFLESLILFQPTANLETVLERYVDETSDLLRVAFICNWLEIQPEQVKSLVDEEVRFRLKRFVRAFDELLGSRDQDFFNTYDKKRQALNKSQFQKPHYETFTLECTKCGNNQAAPVHLKRIYQKSWEGRIKGEQILSADKRAMVMHCIYCLELLPKCCVCLLPIQVWNGFALVSESIKGINGYSEQLRSALVWCPNCRHGGHFQHLYEWSLSNEKPCPVASCDCKCRFQRDRKLWLEIKTK